MMPPSAAVCPGIAEIEQLASGQGVSDMAALHVESCEACRARVEAAREEARFVERVRTLAGPTLGPEGGPRIPGYRVLGVLNSGAQGVVYRAIQESTSRTVAIKTHAPGQTASARQRVRAEREAEIAASLRHPNIVTVFESRTLSDGRTAVVMEYVDGVPLDVWKPAGTSPGERQRELLRVFATVCYGTHHAHLNGVIHRDLKPDNILVTGDGRAVVLDFGIAKAGGIGTTMTGEFAGTPAYASPEQVAGRPDNVDALTDVYSLGVILYRLVCGAMPYEVDGSIFEIAHAIGKTEPVPPRHRDPTLSPDLGAIVMRALRKEKERRYQSAAALAHDIERYLAGDPVEARSGSGWYLLRKAVVLNRRRLAWAGAGMVLLLGAGAAVAISLASAAESSRKASMQRELARAESVRARAVTELLREALPNADPERPELATVMNSGLGRLYFRLETGGFAHEPEVDQALRRLWGEVYTGLGSGKAAGLVQYAEVSLRNGLVGLRREHGQEHPDIAATMHELAGVVLVRKRAPEAERLCRTALEMREKLLGPSVAATADSRALLARILLSLGRRQEATGHADQALAFYRTLPDREADLPIAAMTALKSRERLDAGDATACEPLLRESLVRRLRRLSPEDPELLSSLSDVAELCALAPGCPLGAELVGAWEASPQTLPVNIRRDLPVLGSPDRGDHERAVVTGRSLALGRLVRAQESLLGPDDPALVRVLVAQMRAAESEHLLAIKTAAALRAAEILTRRFGPDDPTILACLEEAALVLAFDGQPDRSVELAQRACGIQDAIPDAARDTLLAANSRRYLAWFLTLAGRDQEAIPVWRRVLVEMRSVLGDEHHVVAVAESGLALCLTNIGDLTGADDLSSRALEMAQRLPATAQDQLADIRMSRGHTLVRLGRFAEARTVLVQAWDSTYKMQRLSFPWRRVLLEDLASACEALGERAEGAVWRGRLD